NPSTDSTTACAKKERTKTACSAPGISMFSTYRASPRRNRGSSVRRAGMPKVEGGMVTAAIVPQPDRGGRRMIRTATRGLAAILILATGTVAPASSEAASVRVATVKAKAAATGLNGLSGCTFAPSGVIWYLVRGTGEVHPLAPRTGK